MGRGEVHPKFAKFFREKMPPMADKIRQKYLQGSRITYVLNTAGHILSYVYIHIYICNIIKDITS